MRCMYCSARRRLNHLTRIHYTHRQYIMWRLNSSHACNVHSSLTPALWISTTRTLLTDIIKHMSSQHSKQECCLTDLMNAVKRPKIGAYSRIRRIMIFLKFIVSRSQSSLCAVIVHRQFHTVTGTDEYLLLLPTICIAWSANGIRKQLSFYGPIMSYTAAYRLIAYNIETKSYYSHKLRHKNYTIRVQYLGNCDMTELCRVRFAVFVCPLYLTIIVMQAYCFEKKHHESSITM